MAAAAAYPLGNHWNFARREYFLDRLDRRRQQRHIIPVEVARLEAAVRARHQAEAQEPQIQENAQH